MDDKRSYKQKVGIESYQDKDPDRGAYYREREARRRYGPSKYDSIRPAGTEKRLSERKSEGLKRAGFGAALAVPVVALETALGSDGGKEGKGPIGAGAQHFAGTGDRFVKSVKGMKDFIGHGLDQYKNAKAKEAKLDRELDDQKKREKRGKANGGAVKKMATGGSVSKRADGIAKRGKTKGRVC